MADAENTYGLSLVVDGVQKDLYIPLPHQIAFHQSETPNLLALGTRGTGKSKMIRYDAIMRCLMFPGFQALIIRRSMQDLRKTHVKDLPLDMNAVGGYYRETTFDAVFPNGSRIQLSHCEKTADVMNYLGSEWGAIYFDELSTFTLEQFLLISASARASVEKPYRAIIRAGSNTLGIGAAWMKAWFVDKDVDRTEFPKYDPNRFEMQFSTLDDNKYLPKEEYTATLQNLPEHVRRAWLFGEFVIEGAYFTDFRPSRIVDDETAEWHVIKTLPTMRDTDGATHSILDFTWLNVYRAIDWGYWPDPAVCLWIAVLPNTRAIVFKERTWKRTLAADVAKQIKRESQGLHITETFCDPTMFVKTGTIKYSIGEIFEQNGVPLTAAQNDRELFGYSIHNYLNTEIDQLPQIQIVKDLGLYGCKNLIRTFPLLQMDQNNPAAVADGEDHWAVALGYFCMGQAAPSYNPAKPLIPRWMMPKKQQSMYNR